MTTTQTAMGVRTADGHLTHLSDSAPPEDVQMRLEKALGDPTSVLVFNVQGQPGVVMIRSAAIASVEIWPVTR